MNSPGGSHDSVGVRRAGAAEPAPATTRERRIARLSGDQRALLYALARADARTAPQAPGIPVAPRTGPPPASFEQRRLWFIDRLDPGNCAYNCPIAIRLRGPLRAAALEGALTDIVGRHEAVRTTFDLEGSEVVQVIRPAYGVTLPVTDLAGLLPPDRERHVTEAITSDLHTPFDLVRGPMLRAQLLRLGPAEHVFIYDVHHIANDGWSVGVFLTELARSYSARVTGSPADLPDLPIQYADYAVWQRGRVTERLVAEQSAYWRSRLDGLSPLNLPTDRPRPPAQSIYGAVAHLDLPADSVAHLTELGRAVGASTFMSLMAVYAVLLARYTGQADLAIGTAAGDRDRADLRNLMGYFGNTILVRADLSGRPGFREVLRRVRDAARDAYGHSDIPFDLLVRELAPYREPGRTPLLDTFFAVDHTPAHDFGFAGLTAETIIPDVLTAKFDIGINVKLGDATPSIHCAYSTDLYDPGTIADLLESFQRLLGSAVADPQRPITELDMLGPRRRHQILVRWNDTAAPYPSHLRLHEPFEAMAARRPRQVAVTCGERQLDFAGLDAAATRLARRLRAAGTGPNAVVGVCVTPSPEFIIAAIAVLKADGAYLPLDPSYPAERLAFMLRDGGATCVVVDDRTRRKLDGLPTPMLVISGDGQTGHGLTGGQAPAWSATPDDLAYVIYTSGSTGVPKGIALRHRGPVNNFNDFNTRFGIGPGDVLLGVSSPSFDMSVYDTLGFLGAGGSLVLPAPAAAPDPASWADLLVRHRITVWHSVPALLDLVLDHLDTTGQPLPALRLALLGGDWIPLTMPGRLRAHAPRARFIALGGATESSMDSTLFEAGQIDPGWTSIPYGRPMANQRAYILDANLQPLPPGVPGELYLAGTGLASRYLGRPALTAERFIEHSFDDGPRERLYRTGDRARYGRDGVIELLGRSDFQIKVHGLRIEPGEIESVLRGYPGIGDVVAVACGAREASTLTAFYVPGAGATVDETALRTWLGDRLPQHMIPAKLIALPTLPTTPNGKVDRRALREYRIERRGAGSAPITPLQERIAAAWRRILDVDDVGLDDNFFDLGGDSFTAIRSVLAIDRRVPVIDLFAKPTVRSLADHISGTLGAPGDPGRAPSQLLRRLLPTRPRVRQARGGSAAHDVVCVPYAGGNPVAYQPLADALPPDWAVWTVWLPGHDHTTLDMPFLSVDEAARQCGEEVASRVSGPVIVYGQCAGVALALRIGQVLEERGTYVSAVYLAAALPDPDPEASQGAYGSVSDEQIHGYLRTLGGFDGALEWAEISAILPAVRHDASGASGFFLRAHREPPVALRAPLRCVFGDRDEATEGYRDRYMNWEPFGSVAGIHTIAGGGHYFVRDHAVEVADLLVAHAGNGSCQGDSG